MPSIYGAVYQPYTYQDLAEPIKDLDQKFKKQEEDILNNINDSEKVMAFLPEGSKSRDVYERYLSGLQQGAEDFYNNGLSSQNGATLFALKRAFGNDIQAINAAVLSRQNKIENFDKSPLGQSRRYIGPRPDDYSVDEYLYGNNPFKQGVNGQEIYDFSEKQAKAATLRRRDEYTSGGYRIDEVGVDQDATQVVIDALNNGFPDLKDLAQYNPYVRECMENNPNQFNYMQSVVNDMFDIYRNAQDTFGYDQFAEFENGIEIPGQNSKRFNSEIISGINEGIQYGRTSKTDDYAKSDYDFGHQVQMLRWNAQKERPDFVGWDEDMNPVFNPYFDWDHYNKTGQKRSNGNENNARTGYIDVETYTNWDINDNDTLLNISQGQNGYTYNDGEIIINDYRGNSNVFTDKLDLYNQIHYADQNLDQINNEFNRIIKELYNSTPYPNSTFDVWKKNNGLNGNNYDLALNIVKLNNDINLNDEYSQDLLKQLQDSAKQYIQIYNQNKDIKEKAENSGLLLTDKQYNKTKELYGLQDKEFITMGDINERKQNPEYVGQYKYYTYSITNPASVDDNGNKKTDKVIQNLSGFFLNSLKNTTDDKITVYEVSGPDKYKISSKTKDVKEFTKKDKDKLTGILGNVINYNITPGMLYNTEGGHLNPLIEITYMDDNKVKSVIVPTSWFGSNMNKYTKQLGLVFGNKLNSGNFDINNPLHQEAIKLEFRKSLNEVASLLE